MQLPWHAIIYNIVGYYVIADTGGALRASHLLQSITADITSLMKSTAPFNKKNRSKNSCQYLVCN